MVARQIFDQQTVTNKIIRLISPNGSSFFLMKMNVGKQRKNLKYRTTSNLVQEVLSFNNQCYAGSERRVRPYETD